MLLFPLCQTPTISHRMEASNVLSSFTGQTTAKENFVQAPNRLTSAKVPPSSWGVRAGGKLRCCTSYHQGIGEKVNEGLASLTSSSCTSPLFPIGLPIADYTQNSRALLASELFPNSRKSQINVC